MSLYIPSWDQVLLWQSMYENVDMLQKVKLAKAPAMQQLREQSPVATPTPTSTVNAIAGTQMKD